MKTDPTLTSIHNAVLALSSMSNTAFNKFTEKFQKTDEKLMKKSAKSINIK